MDLKNIENLVKKGIKWSWEKQLKVFLKNNKTTKLFKEAVKSSEK